MLAILKRIKTGGKQRGTFSSIEGDSLIVHHQSSIPENLIDEEILILTHLIVGYGLTLCFCASHDLLFLLLRPLNRGDSSNINRP